jgi:TolB protein
MKHLPLPRFGLPRFGLPRFGLPRFGLALLGAVLATGAAAGFVPISGVFRSGAAGHPVSVGVARLFPESGATDSRAAGTPTALPQEAGDWYLDMTRPGAPVRMAIPDFEVLPSDSGPESGSGESPADDGDTLGGEATEAASVTSAVLWDDIEYAGMYRMLPKRFYRIAEAGSAEGVVDYYQWESIGADIVIDGKLWIEGDLLLAEVRMHAVRAQENVFGRRYTAARGAARTLAHRIADDILQHAGNYQGVARTRIAFSTSRTQPRSKEIYLMDYDGHGQRPVTANGSLNLTPSWSPDGRALSYISYREGAPSLYLAFLYQGRGEKLVGDFQSFTPAWSPDGQWIAFTSNRDGQSEIYLAAVDGSELRRLTDNRAIDVAPTWSPNGRAIAFTSDRTGAPQIYTMDRDGLNLRRVSFEGSYNDSPAWSPSRQYSEIAYASRIERRPFDIVVHDFETRQTRQLTTGRGSNESPSWAPNGLHIAFTSNRAGNDQVFTMHRDGSNLKQLTREGSNTTPRWGNPPGGPQ